MSLTLDQFLFLVMTIAVVVAVTFLVMLMIQLKKTAKEGEKTLFEINELVKRLQDTSEKINEKMDDVGGIVKATKQSVFGLAEISTFLVLRIIRPTRKYWYLFPLIRLGWRISKKIKEEKNGR
jgi:uncharacterized protein YoxC